MFSRQAQDPGFRGHREKSILSYASSSIPWGGVPKTGGKEKSCHWLDEEDYPTCLLQAERSAFHEETDWDMPVTIDRGDVTPQ